MRVLMSAALVSVFTGCVAPRVITSISSSPGEMKLLYAQPATTNTGIIECQVQEDGTLTECRRLPITFNDK